jgi:predicted nucleic acid-binding protein
MGGSPLAPSEAWRAYADLRELPEVVLLTEPDACEPLLGEWALRDLFTPRVWTDAYLAAFAVTHPVRLVSFDSDFSRFPGLDLLRLQN